jgi:phosphoglycolate phosphatase
MEKVSVVVSDLDNTLFDWFHMWYHSFSTLLDELSARSGIDKETLIAAIRKVHQKHGTSEYAFLLQELPLLRGDKDNDPSDLYAGVMEAAREASEAHLELYPTVRETLEYLKSLGCCVVAYTESMGYYTKPRIMKLGLDGLLDYIYSPADHDFPQGAYKTDHQLKKTVHCHTPEGERKPNPRVLLDILADIGASARETIYVGDSLMKDIAMAQDAGVTDVLAQYGSVVGKEAYALLRAVSHWTEADVVREREINEGRTVIPTCVLDKNFGQLLDLFKFDLFKHE